MSSSRIQHNRSSVAGAIPDPSSLAVGEIAVNFPDRYIYTKNGASAVIRLTGHVPLVQPLDEKPGDAYIDTATGKMHAYYEVGAAGDEWHEIAPPEDLTPYVPLSGGTMTGALVVFGTAAGNEGIGFNQIDTIITTGLVDYLKKDGSEAMTGPLTLVATPPVDDLHAASKAYVDGAVDIATPDLSGYLSLAGGVMTGHINLPGGAAGNQAASAVDLAASLSSHTTNPDPHPQYANITDFTFHIEHGASQHPLVTGSVHGFMSSTDKTRFDTVVPATEADITAGVDASKYVSPAGLGFFTATAVFDSAREKLTENRIYYVRTDGNDANTGSADTAGGAFLTWQKAVDRAAAVDFNGGQIVLKCSQTGVTFTAGAIIPPLVGATRTDALVLQGNPTTPSSVVISVSGTHCFKADGGLARIEGFKFVLSATATAAMLWAENHGRIEQRQNTFGVLTQNSHTNAHMMAITHARITTIGNYTVDGASGGHLRAAELGAIDCISHTLTLTGTPAIGTFAYSTMIGLIDYSFGAGFSGAASGSRYSSNGNSVILVPSPVSTTFFPGSTAGSTSNGGVYVA